MNLQLALVVALIGGYALVAAALDRHSVGPAVVFVGDRAPALRPRCGLCRSALRGREPRRRADPGAWSCSRTRRSSGSTRSARTRAWSSGSSPSGCRSPSRWARLVAAVAWPAIPLAVALLIGSSLAPTDAALGQPVISDTAVPVRVRRMLNVESGLNDGIATPFVLVAVALAAHPGAGGDWVADAAFEMAIAVVAGCRGRQVRRPWPPGGGCPRLDDAAVAAARGARDRADVLPRVGRPPRQRLHRGVRRRPGIRASQPAGPGEGPWS